MFHAIEKYKLPAQILLGVIGLSFVFAGGYSLTLTGSDYITEVGNNKISSADVTDALRRVQQNGQKIDEQTIYQSLLDQAYLLQGAQNLGVAVSVEQIKKIIVADPEFQENGHFSEDKYRQFLQQSGLNEQTLIAGLRKELMIRTLFNLTQAGNLVSDQQARQMLTLLHSPRQIQTISFSVENFAPKVVLDNSKLKEFYEKNKSKYFLKEGIKFEFIGLSPLEMAEKQTVNEEEIKEAYDQLAVSASEPKPALADVTKQLTEQIKHNKAIKAVLAAKETLSDLTFNNPDSLEPAAKKLGLTIIKMDKDWVTLDIAKEQKLPQNMQDALFSSEVLDKRHNSDLIDLGNNQYLVVRALDVRKEHQASFDEIKDQVQKDYIEQESKKLAINEANKVLQKALNNQNIEHSWSSVNNITPQNASMIMGEEDFKNWIKAKPQNEKAAYVLLKQGDVPILVKVNSILPPPELNSALSNMKNLLTQNEGQQLLLSTLEWLKANVKVKSGKQKLDNND